MSNPRKDYKLYFLDMDSSCKKISSYTRGLTFKEFTSEPKTIDAVVRNLEIIGEAVNKVPPEIRKETSEIPWNEIVGLRNKVIHEYFDVNIPIIWETVKDDIPNLQRQVKKVLKELGSKQLKLTS